MAYYASRPCTCCKKPYSPKREDQKYCSKKCLILQSNRNTYTRRRDELNAKRKLRYYANRDQKLEQNRLRYAENLEKSRKLARQNYQKYKATYAAGSRKRRESMPNLSEYRAAEYKRSRQKAPWKLLIRNAQRRAEKKKLPFDLTHEWASTVWTGRCNITKLPFRIGDKNMGTFSPSIDRIIPALGYTQNNCRFILMGVNALKHQATDNEMFLVAKAILESTVSDASDPSIR